MMLFLFFACCYFVTVFLNKSSFYIDAVNIVVYVTGHQLGAFFGQTGAMAGGTVLTLALPLMLGVWLLSRRRRADAAGMLFWVFLTLHQTSGFIASARESFTGVINGRDDWFLILRHFDLSARQGALVSTLDITALVGMTVGIGLALIFLLHSMLSHELVYESEN